ncbi:MULTISPECIES: DNA-processing protein DprA [unclassified Chitinophaga]|uniref:DNA-processing protein DprA n=1 Tax=unclassified Chitinophaga TaxID=2619133 RepID=UPI0009CFA477|nr:MULTISPECIES: DNA-processing protein DprA [unclassified Chitinophaga]OMP77172.1 DNA protecting protein DprA [[Flexibacter] sp. ATCC 35208]WPV67350.1 DNA-processing protein DprA [Chitinophaga sp. LS1]
MQEETRYQIALTKIPQIGNKIAQQLTTYFENAGNIFKASRRELESLPMLGKVRANAIRQFNDFRWVDREMNFLEKYQIAAISFQSPLYPQRLLHCYDHPFLLYYKGNANLNTTRIINVIGTRTPTAHGREVCANLIAGLEASNIMVVSGLAYGIDVLAHATALKHGMPTIGILAHGLDRIYPDVHANTARQMVEQGGLLTEYGRETTPDKPNFPKRNRIVAGMSDATVLIESGIKGGSMITADIANSYNRDVFAIPGRVGDPKSAGCHHLIKNNQAMLITDAEDILKAMNWDDAVRKPVMPQQQEIQVELKEEERQILALFNRSEHFHIDHIYSRSPLPESKVASVIFQLEMNKLLRSAPGQRYQLV